MTDITKLTPPQRRALTSSIGSRPFDGLLEFRGAGTGVGLQRAAWNRMVGKLKEMGLVTPYVHGGYELTEEGRRVRDALAALPQP